MMPDTKLDLHKEMMNTRNGINEDVTNVIF
jgi:hypothetical protein